MKLHMYLIKSEFNFKRYFATMCVVLKCIENKTHTM